MDAAKFEIFARRQHTMPIALTQTPKGAILIAEAFRRDDPEHTTSDGVIVPGWKMVWGINRKTVGFYGVVWCHAGTTRKQRVDAVIDDALKYMDDNERVSGIA